VRKNLIWLGGGKWGGVGKGSVCMRRGRVFFTGFPCSITPPARVSDL